VVANNEGDTADIYIGGYYGDRSDNTDGDG
jgi:hypothetical protein